ncbi:MULTISPECIES: plasmid mobilization relaxosome protein MobC [unclassified Parabacteroides]|uniref:plasmid mobilization protein n=1 Tax=unclassified Parabacteroides TaxID=2649774 RepID=UPI002475F543|nr:MULTISPECIES: plasmid mobilization relaxosome protein MobC [unclassified Parabacteroides]
MEENKAKRGWGRGRRKPKVNRTESIYIRCTVEEKEAIKKIASEYGLEVSAFLRKKALYKEASLINAVEFLSMYRESVHELKKIGNNINQVARYVNYAQKTGDISPALLEEVSNYLQDFIRSQREVADLERKILRG